MHVMYIHQNFPAQFGHLAEALTLRHGFRCTYVSERPERSTPHLRRVRYAFQQLKPEAKPAISEYFCDFTERSLAVFKELLRCKGDRPDVIVSHSGFGSTLFLRELFDCPIIHFCEWFYRKYGGDGDFFGEYVRSDAPQLSTSVRNATLLADLELCNLGYAPTHWQRSQIPHEYQYKLETIFDGIDTQFWRRAPATPTPGPRVIAGKTLPEGKRIVTYVSRGFESMRGFDVFMRAAKEICRRRQDVVFLCIGSDRVCYGGDLNRIKEKSFREHVWKQDDFDESRFIFTGVVSPAELVRAFSLSDLHIYLTAPFVLSWSLMDALACECNVLASDTPPLREVIQHGRNGLLAPYWDPERFAELACQVLDDPEGHRRTLGRAARETIEREYSLDRVLPRMVALYERAIHGPAPVPGSHVPQGAFDSELDSAAERGSVKASWKDRWKLLTDSMLTPPEGKGTRPAGATLSWLSNQAKAALTETIPTNATCILELGAFRGEATAWLAANFPKARVVAVDEWSGARFPQPKHPHWRTMLPEIWRSFSANCWDFKTRVWPWKDRQDLALPKLKRLGVRPDVVVIHPDYDTSSVLRLLKALQLHYPEGPWVGCHWHWPALQALLTRQADGLGRRLAVRGPVWKLAPLVAQAPVASLAVEERKAPLCESWLPSPTTTDRKPVQSMLPGA